MQALDAAAASASRKRKRPLGLRRPLRRTTHGPLLRIAPAADPPRVAPAPQSRPKNCDSGGILCLSREFEVNSLVSVVLFLPGYVGSARMTSRPFPISHYEVCL